MKKEKTISDQRMGSDVRSATWVGNCSASDLGTSSPSTIASTVRTTRMTPAAVERGAGRRSGSTRDWMTPASGPARVACPYAPMMSEVRVMPIWQAAM